MSDQEAQGTKVGEGRYLYCIANNDAELSFGDIGIEDAEVYTIPHKEISAIVHVREGKVYQTDNNEKAKEWIFTHNYVIDEAKKKFGTVLPFSFDCIIKGNDDTVRNALSNGYEELKEELEGLRGKSEYTVQIFCDQAKFTRKMVEENQELKDLREKIKEMPKKASYLHQRKFELKLKDTMSAEFSRLAEEFGSKIRKYAKEMKVEKSSRIPEKYKDKKLVVTLSCLVSEEKVERLGQVLHEINDREEYDVRFTGPWAPFSFVKLKEIGG